MLNMTFKTSLKPSIALDQAIAFFIAQSGLKAVEIAAHLHGREGATEIRVSGEKLVGKAEYTSRDVLDRVVGYMKEQFGFSPVYYLLHLHGTPDESVGHLVITVTEDEPTELDFQCEEYDSLVQDFVSSLPKA